MVAGRVYEDNLPDDQILHYDTPEKRVHDSMPKT